MQAFANNPDVAFGDVNLADQQINHIGSAKRPHVEDGFGLCRGELDHPRHKAGWGGRWWQGSVGTAGDGWV